jgi:hypothetical protein
MQHVCSVESLLHGTEGVGGAGEGLAQTQSLLISRFSILIVATLAFKPFCEHWWKQEQHAEAYAQSPCSA